MYPPYHYSSIVSIKTAAPSLCWKKTVQCSHLLMNKFSCQLFAVCVRNCQYHRVLWLHAASWSQSNGHAKPNDHHGSRCVTVVMATEAERCKAPPLLSPSFMLSVCPSLPPGTFHLPLWAASGTRVRRNVRYLLLNFAMKNPIVSVLAFSSRPSEAWLSVAPHHNNSGRNLCSSLRWSHNSSAPGMPWDPRCGS